MAGSSWLPSELAEELSATNDFYSYKEDDYADEELRDTDYDRPVTPGEIFKATERERDRARDEWVHPDSVAEAKAFVADGLEKLTPKQRWILQLFYGLLDQRCYSTREIAEYMGVSHVAVQRAKDRAEEQLRKRLEFGGYHLALIGSAPVDGGLVNDATNRGDAPEGATEVAAGDGPQKRSERVLRAETRRRHLRRDPRLGETRSSRKVEPGRADG